MDHVRLDEKERGKRMHARTKESAKWAPVIVCSGSAGPVCARVHDTIRLTFLFHRSPIFDLSNLRRSQIGKNEHVYIFVELKIYENFKTNTNVSITFS